MERNLAKALDDHITGRFNPDAPFNQVDPEDKWGCSSCNWTGDEPVETTVTETYEFWGEIVKREMTELSCPLCASEVSERPAPEEDDGEELDPEYEDDNDDEDFDDEEDGDDE